MRSAKGRGGHQSTKAYVSFFFCLVTKEIHLELLSDLTAATFIAAFKRFCSRRGNGTNFLGANAELKKSFRAIITACSTYIAESLAKDFTAWHFSPQFAPHLNGLAEALIGSAKNLIK